MSSRSSVIIHSRPRRQLGRAHDPLIKEARDRQRRRRRRRGFTLIAPLLIATLIYGVHRWDAGGGSPQPPAPPRSAASNGHERAFHADGLILAYPHDWFLTRPVPTGISNPVERFVLASYRVPAGEATMIGDFAIARRQVVAQLLEVQAPDQAIDQLFPSRPATFNVPTLTTRVEGHDGRWAELTFRQRRRDFYLFVGAGKNAGRIQVDALLRQLDQLRIR
jgi:hypothetical protein